MRKYKSLDMLNDSLEADVKEVVEREKMKDANVNASEIKSDSDQEYRLNPKRASEIMKTEYKPLFEPVKGLITEGLSFYVGGSKLGKSWQILQMACAVVHGETFLGREVTKCPVLYLALEDGERRIQARLNGLNETINENDDLLIQTKVRGMDNGLINALEHWLKEQKTQCLVIVDTFIKIRGKASKNEGAYEADYRVSGIIKDLADRYQSAIICVHHTNKYNQCSDVFEKVNGTTGLMGAADSTIILQRERGSLAAKLFCTGRDIEEAEISINLVDNKWIAESEAETFMRTKSEYEKNPMAIVIKRLMKDSVNRNSDIKTEDFATMVKSEAEASYLTDTNYTSFNIQKKLKSIEEKLEQFERVKFIPIMMYEYDKDGTRVQSRGLRFYRLKDAEDKGIPLV